MTLDKVLLIVGLILMTLDIVLLIVGLILIVLGANYLVDGASSIAKRSGLSEFVIGLTIVGIGTSTPEMVVSFMSAFNGEAEMAVGNVVGSNLFNTFAILGLTAIISPIPITRSNLRKDIPLNIIVTILMILLGLNSTIFKVGHDTLSRWDGAVLFCIFLWYIISSIKNGKSAGDQEESDIKQYSTTISIIMLIGGIAGLVIGGRLFVNSATSLAEMAGISKKIIAVTIFAVGTSLPELATSIVAAKKGRNQLALGNILGSNIFNIILILGGSALITPLPLSGMGFIDLGAVLLSAIVIMISAYTFRKKEIDRVEGVIFLIMEALYMYYTIAMI